MIRNKTVHRDFTPSTTPRPLVKGDVVRDPYFPTCLSVFSHVEQSESGPKLVFSEGDNFAFVSSIKYGALVHADGAPIDVTGLVET